MSVVTSPVKAYKQPREKRKYVFDFSELMSDSETISSIDVYESEIDGGGTSDLTLGSPSVGSDNQSVECWIEDGTDGVQYRVECVVTTSGGQILEADGRLVCRDT